METAFRPSRIVDLGDDPNAQLLTVANTENLLIPAYICLSYSWGGPQRLRFESQRSQNWTFVTNKLAATFRDAYRIARQLGYRYIWIEALCINQSDKDDVEREILQMPHIYKNAEITICASIEHHPLMGFSCRGQITASFVSHSHCLQDYRDLPTSIVTDSPIHQCVNL